MVGVPRSTGCTTCVKRRIKCDERRPQCENCQKYQTPCPGYERALKFITGKPRPTKRPRAGDSLNRKSASPLKLDRSATTPPTSVTQSLSNWSHQHQERLSPSQVGSELLQTTGSTDKWNLQVQQSMLFPDLVVTLPAMIHPQKLYQLQLVTSLSESLPKTTNPQEIQMITSYLRHLPERFGNSKALDAAIVAFTTLQIGTTFDDTQMLRAGQATYVQALALLQRSLNDSTEALRSETYCAAFLLCTYELFAGTTAFNSWMKHAAGLSKLILHRGPDRFQNDFDIAVLRACRSLIIMDCMFTGKSVFLTDRRWREITRGYKARHMDEGFHNFFEDFNDLLAQIPELLAPGWDLREAHRLGKSLPLSEDQILDLAWKTTNIYSRFQVWYRELEERLPFPSERPSATKDPVFPTVYVFETNSAGGLYTNYWACMIILQMILHTCGCMPEDAIDSRELANRICKSVEWNSEGTWGGYRLGFSIRIAFEAADPEVKRWIGEWHLKLSKNYAATSIQGLPQDPAIDKLKKQMAGLP